MMDTQVDRELLEKIADLIGKPVGAFNIRKDCGCDGRVSTEHIKIDDRTDGHAGIDIRILDGTKGETCHIPVIITKSGVEETVYNDFYIGEDCDVEIVAGCGIHTFHVGKNSHVHYSEKHYAEGDGRGEKIMNPQTIVYLEEGASIQMDTVQIRGVDSTKRYTKIVCGKGAEAVITIRDYGPGIPAEELPHVKYKFYKGSSKARGSGIGLAVCDEIITRHEGTLDIDNAEGGGCIVTIHLPIRAQAVIEQKF